MARPIFYVVLFALSLPVFGQPALAPVSGFTFKYSNDFTHFTDRYYSNGIFVEFIDLALAKNPLNYLLLSLGKEQHIYNALTLTQDFFTPDFTVDPATSRPFSSYLLVGTKQLVIIPAKKMRLTSELQIGLIGTNSGGEFIQNSTHAIFPGATPVNWDKQISNALGLNYRVLVEKQAFLGDFVQITLHGEGQIGTPFSQLSVGSKLQLGLFENYFMALGSYARKWQVYFYNDVKGSAVLHNSTIQGGVFSDDPYTRDDLTRWLLNIETGVGVGYRKVILEMGQHLLSPEFAAGEAHEWGYFNLKVRF
jgi:hypothetical protein